MVYMQAKGVGALVTEARQGSTEARDELVRRHYRQAAVLAAATVNDATEAEDLAQEAFVRAFRNLDLLVDPERFSAWLRRIVIGVSVDWLRSFRPNLYRGWDGADDVAPAHGLSPLEHLLQSEMVDRVRTALEALPPHYRVPLRLYHLDGLSHGKIPRRRLASPRRQSGQSWPVRGASWCHYSPSTHRAVTRIPRKCLRAPRHRDHLFHGIVITHSTAS